MMNKKPQVGTGRHGHVFFFSLVADWGAGASSRRGWKKYAAVPYPINPPSCRVLCTSVPHLQWLQFS